MAQRNDPDTLKIPAYMRSKAIVKRDRQRLLWTAWDRKEAGVKPNSPRALGKVERPNSVAPGPVVPGRTRTVYTQKSKTTTARKTPAFMQKSVAGQTLQNRTPAFLRPSPAPKIETVQNETDFESPITPSLPQKFPHAGETTHYLSNINVAIIKTTVPLKIGDVLLIQGDGYLFTQPITEMQIDRKPVKRAKKGSHIGLKVTHEAAVNGTVYILK